MMPTRPIVPSVYWSGFSISCLVLPGSFDQYEPLLEPILLSYVEHIAKVESTEELLEDDNVERLIYALGLCELLVPTMRNINILSSVGKLLVLTHGANYRHGTPLSKVRNIFLS